MASNNHVAVTATGNEIAPSGTVAERPAEPVTGLLDIGTSDVAYLFRMSLPGVSRCPGDFCCEIERNGRVVVKGIALMGQKKVCRYSQIFEMKSQHLGPPGNFSISFQLPGPVDPRGFTATFGSDGIFEAMVVKSDQHYHNKVQADQAPNTPTM